VNVYLETYGCQMNVYDSEIIRTLLLDADFTLTGRIEDADVILLNTCAVREGAAQKVRSRIGTLRQRRNGEAVKIGLLGCMASHNEGGESEIADLPVDFAVGPDSYRRLGRIIRQSVERGVKGMDVRLTSSEMYEGIEPLRAAGVNAWVVVMRGCNNFCSFCVVPYTRGRERSRSPESVKREVERLAEAGFVQVTLLGQNVNSYNYKGVRFADLVDSLCGIEGLKRIRFTSPHPKDFPESLLDVMAGHPVLCRHIHLPLQAGSDRILAKMNRTYSRESYYRLVEQIRARFPDICLSTDLIVGFPGETASDFEQTVDLVRRVGFDSAYMFKYSARPGTLAVRRYLDDVPERVKTERIVRLNELQKEISLAKNRLHIGEIQHVLIEQTFTRKSQQQIQGRNDGNKIVILPKGAHSAGDFVNAVIVDATANVLKGEITTERTERVL